LTFAKTGRFFAMADELGPIPTDITVIGKSLGFGILPISLVIARRALTIRATGAVATSDLRPLACAILCEGIHHIIEQRLLEKSVVLGEVLRSLLSDIAVEFPDLFTEIRGAGFLNGIELTERAAANIPQFRRCMIENGVYVEFMAGAGRRSGGARHVMPAMRIAPPLIARTGDIEAIARAILAGAADYRQHLT
jgi:acetylornithine/N-succinyldiaminopimelate aminotransferase